ncbi:MAG: hypothetical protein E7398_04770 [Ruminococcaceae bacterium]|nr:hypothetical protein [Oscillospiraceae bacterium]
MKKIFSLILTIILLSSLFLSVTAHPDNLTEYIFVVKNDEAVVFGEERPFTIAGYTYVPDYILSDCFELTTSWTDAEKMLTISRGLWKVKAFESQNLLELPSKSMNIKFYRSNDVSMVPLEPVAEALGFGVSYLPEGKLLRITNGKEKMTNSEILNKFMPQIRREKWNFTPFVPKNSKKIYITFDDGPSEKNTPVILDILKKHNAKATFFMLSGNMDKNPEIVKKIKAEGHTVALHGVTHNYSKFYGSAWAPADEMGLANITLKKILGDGSSIVRVPYGSSPNLTNTQYNNIKNSGYLMWDWNVDSEDSLKANVSSQTIYNNAVNGLNKVKGEPVVLFHDKTNVVYCLDAFLTYVKSRGYYPVAITDKITPYNWKER